MKKALIALALIFAVGVVHAESGKDWKGWYNTMLKGLKTKVQKKLESKTRVSAVAAVRGAKQGEDANALYWKGGVSEKAQKKLADEKKQLTDAVELVVGGDVEGGRAALKKFIKDNPESFFAPDAKEALDNLPAAEVKTEESKTEAPAGEPAAEEKPDAKTGK
jgi:chemotaxis response regulator CheB